MSSKSLRHRSTSKMLLKTFAGTILEVTLHVGKVQQSRGGARAEIHDVQLSIVLASKNHYD